jgi:hypothetical protein
MEENEAENMEGVESTSPSAITPLMTEDERRILELYDRLEELQLEIAVLKAQGVLTQGMSVISSQPLFRTLTSSRWPGRAF